MDDPQVRQDDEHLRLLSIFHYVVGGLMALFASFPLLHLAFGIAMVSGVFPSGKDEPPAFVGWFFIVIATVLILAGWGLAACTVVAGRSLAQRTRYTFCLVVAGAMAVTCMPLGTVLGVFTIVVLMRPSVKRAFAAAA